MTSAFTGLREKGAPYPLGLQDYKDGNPTQMNLSTNESELGGSKEDCRKPKAFNQTLYVLTQHSLFTSNLCWSLLAASAESSCPGQKDDHQEP